MSSLAGWRQMVQLVRRWDRTQDTLTAIYGEWGQCSAACPAHHTWLLLRRGCCQWCEHCTVTCRLLVLTSIEIYGYLPKWAFTCSFFIAKIQNTTCQVKISWESLPNSLCIHIHHSIDVKICQLSSEWCQYDRGHDRGRGGCYSDHQNPVVS